MGWALPLLSPSRRAKSSYYTASFLLQLPPSFNPLSQESQARLIMDLRLLCLNREPDPVPRLWGPWGLPWTFDLSFLECKWWLGVERVAGNKGRN